VDGKEINMSEKIKPTSDEVAEAIKKIAKRLSKKFRFGYYTAEDIHQEIAVLCMEALPKYDGIRPLENFLWTHCHHRLCNLKRDKYERRDKPCLKCPLYDPNKTKSQSECLRFENKNDCELYSDWIIRNEKKKNLVNSSVESTANSSEGRYEIEVDSMDRQIIIDLIDKHLPVHMREDYVKFKYNIRLNKLKQQTLLEEIRRICSEHGVADVN
jgi:DNA-directed RNA polymerase specialized sigma24 family protein